MPKKLDEYRAKRSPDTTPEPFGGDVERPQLFVVQKHAARRLHYDFRLELGGTLKSWAVPKGPSYDPSEKRLAVQVEDHPVEYADFEGVIPKGNYGAGEVIVWDRGRWVPLEDPVRGLEKGKLLFELHGYKLHGVWTLVRTKGAGRNGGASKDWLLIKHADAWSGPGRALPQASVLSGRTVEELRDGDDAPVRSLEVDLKAAGAAPLRAAFSSFAPMLAETGTDRFSRKGWIFELKLDGFRALGMRDEASARLVYRRGLDASATYPEVVRALAALPFARFVLDGEIAVLDAEGKPSFQGLQKRAQLSRRSDIERMAVELPATYFAFDMLAFDGLDLRALALLERKRFLKRLLPSVGPLRYVEHVEEKGAELFAEVAARGLEGVMAKRADAPYRAGRSSDWLKWRTERTGDFVVVGFTEPKGSRLGLGSLQVAEYEGEELRYRGGVGSGFSDALLKETRADLEALEVPSPPCRHSELAIGDVRWVAPKRVCEVRYKELTSDGLLRQSTFLRFREDKAPEECRARPAVPPPPPLDPEPAPKVVRLTNLDKVFWPKEGYTKGDLIEYYRDISPWLLPYLRDRPLVLTRYPDGIEGKSFFQKDAPGFAPGWIRTERIWSEQAQREIDYFVCNDVETLVYLANLGTIPIHFWASRIGSEERPDWSIVDLDPKGAPFAHVVKLARAVHELCDEIDLPCFLKTSGATGLHVLLPLGGQCSYAESRTLAEIVARVIESRHGDISTTARALAERGGRVYLDYLQNGHGQTIAAPFSARPVPGASVSMPLRWREAGPRLDPRQFNLGNAAARMRRLKEDPMAPILTLRPELERVLDALQQRVAR